MTNKERIDQAWATSYAKWPPSLGEHVRLFQPKVFRGRVAKVVATAMEKSKTANRKPKPGKVRVTVKDVSGNTHQFNVGMYEAFPREFTLKQLEQF